MSVFSPSTLPSKYYRDNFIRLLLHVESIYSDLLKQSERHWIESFHTLSENAQCLVIRLMTRKGIWFRDDKLNYPEIGCLDSPISELMDYGFISTEPPTSSFELASTLLSKPEILTFYSDLKRTAKKNQLIEQLRHQQPNHVPKLPFTVVRLLDDEVLPLLCLLFFGNRHQEFAQFVLENLGIHKFEDYEVSKATRLFNSRTEIDSTLAITGLRIAYTELKKPCSKLIRQFADLLPSANGQYATRQLDKLTNLIARDLERQGDLDLALSLFESSRLPPSRERQVRILIHQGKFEAAIKLTLIMIKSPLSIDEQEVGERLKTKLDRKLKIALDRTVKPSFPERRFNLDLSHERVELVVCNKLADLGWKVFYLENQFLNTMFGLVFWDIIFAPVEGAFINPFQRQPLDLYHPSFIEKRKGAIEQRLSEVKRNGVKPYLNILETKKNMQNPFIVWDLVDTEWLELAMTSIDYKQLADLFAVLLSDLRAYRNGMPDLVAFKGNEWLWCEVKGPGDKLQNNQKRWFKQMERLNINYEVCYVNND
ncbi:VRR-NUC domain-containing protein [Vibrio mediterranei]|uniref:phosphodiesterase I n=1 Tax=Vibrio barjaei TaxID=1676683 RepID=A0ABW7IF89_9VIBR